MTTEEGNKIIAEFMGLWLVDINDDTKISEDQFWIDELKYHYSWNWLMPVVEKISGMSIGDVKNAYPRTFGMIDDEGQIMVRLNGFQLFRSDTLIEATYNAVVAFILWHTTQQTNKD